MELLAKLGINWQLLLAQVVNFAVVLGVLTLFLYRPILRVLDERRERIRRSLEDAQRLEEETKQLGILRLERLKKIDAECGTLLERAKVDAERLRQETLDRARTEAQAIVTRGRATVREEHEKALSELQAVLARAVTRLLEKILEREFTPADHERLVVRLREHIPSALR